MNLTEMKAWLEERRTAYEKALPTAFGENQKELLDGVFRCKFLIDALTDLEEYRKESKRLARKDNKAVDENVGSYFDTIWKLYPRKVAKVTAKNTFMRKFRGLDYDGARALANKIYAVLKKQLELWQEENDWQGRATEYIPHFATWLNANFENGEK